VGHGVRDGRLASAGHPLQPEDAFAVEIVRPIVDIAEEVDSGTGIAIDDIRVVFGVIKSTARSP
jgi:hypothetical protein